MTTWTVQTAEEAAADVLTQITRLTQATAWPPLSSDDLNGLVLEARRQDKFGRPPFDPNWWPTYHIAFGVYRGWQIKMGYCATMYDTGDGQVKFDRSQAIKGCKAMVDQYAKRLTSSVVTYAPQRSPITPIPAFPIGPIIMPTEPEQGNN